MSEPCHLCEIGFPLDGINHVPTHGLGMIKVTRCRKHIKRGDRNAFRAWLNFKEAETQRTRHNHKRFNQRTRPYGDYLYFQDRQKFDMEMCQWLAATPAIRSLVEREGL